MRIVPDPRPVGPLIAGVGAWMPVRLGLVDDDHPALDRWRAAHRACVDHLTSCPECGLELCSDGRALWDAADEAERALPWRLRA